MKFILFRFDRIGDYLLSSILINNLKKQINNCHFTVVCSEKNYEYVKHSFLVNEALIIPNNFLKRIKFYLKMIGSKYDNSIVLDGKKKSIISSILVNSKNNILITNNKLFTRLLCIFFNKIFYSSATQNKIDELISVSNYLNFNFDIFSAKYENKYNIINQNIIELINDVKNFNLFHFDEKWIFNSYIKSYINIEPNTNNLVHFFKLLSKKTNNNLIVSTGMIDNNLTSFLKSKFIKIDTNIYKYELDNKSIFLIEKINIFNLEYIISKSSTVITCHGAPSHLTNMYNKNLIDIIDESEEQIFRNYSHHFTNTNTLIRINFDTLSNNIINLF